MSARRSKPEFKPDFYSDSALKQEEHKSPSFEAALKLMQEYPWDTGVEESKLEQNKQEILRNCFAPLSGSLEKIMPALHLLQKKGILPGGRNAHATACIAALIEPSYHASYPEGIASALCWLHEEKLLTRIPQPYLSQAADAVHSMSETTPNVLEGDLKAFCINVIGNPKCASNLEEFAEALCYLHRQKSRLLTGENRDYYCNVIGDIVSNDKLAMHARACVEILVQLDEAGLLAETDRRNHYIDFITNPAVVCYIKKIVAALEKLLNPRDEKRSKAASYVETLLQEKILPCLDTVIETV